MTRAAKTAGAMLVATTMVLVSAVSAAVSTASPLAGPTEHSKRTSSTVCV
jgi:hypothetical protein